jgi:hypothetical protein
MAAHARTTVWPAAPAEPAISAATAAAARRSACCRAVAYRGAGKVASRHVASRRVVWHGGDRKWPLSDGQSPGFRGVREALGPGYTRGEGNRRASRNGRVSDLPRPKPHVATRDVVVGVCHLRQARGELHGRQRHAAVHLRQQNGHPLVVGRARLLHGDAVHRALEQARHLYPPPPRLRQHPHARLVELELC